MYLSHRETEVIVCLTSSFQTFHRQRRNRPGSEVSKIRGESHSALSEGALFPSLSSPGCHVVSHAVLKTRFGEKPIRTAGWIAIVYKYKYIYIYIFISTLYISTEFKAENLTGKDTDWSAEKVRDFQRQIALCPSAEVEASSSCSMIPQTSRQAASSCSVWKSCHNCCATVLICRETLEKTIHTSWDVKVLHLISYYQKTMYYLRRVSFAGG